MAGQPQLTNTYIDKAIQNAAIAYGNSAYIADQVAPIVEVTERTGKYFTFDSGESVIDSASPNRQPGTEAPRGGYTVSNESYDCKEWAFAHEIPDEVAAQADPAVAPFQRGIRFAMEKVLLRRERATAAILFASSWGTNSAPGTTWDDLDDCDIASDVQAGKSSVLQKTGWEANTLVVGRPVFDKMILNPDLTDRIKYTQRADFNALKDAIAAWLGIERFIVGGASYNAAAEGATVDRQFIWGKNALLMYVPASPALNEPSAAYNFQLRGVNTRQWREESPKQTVVEAAICGDPKLTSSNAGYYWPGAVA